MTSEVTSSALLDRSCCLCGSAPLPGGRSSPLDFTAAKKRRVSTEAQGSAKAHRRNQSCLGVQHSGESGSICAVSDAGVSPDSPSAPDDVMH